MTFAVHVQGGTGAGVKRPLKVLSGPWHCQCGIVDTSGSRRWKHEFSDGTTMREQPRYRANCPDCGARRPNTSEDT